MPPGGGPRLDCQAGIQFGRVHFGVFSTSRFMPLALSSDLTRPALSSVIVCPSVVCHLSLTGDSNWLEVMIFRHSQGFQLTRSDNFLSLMGVPTDWKWWYFVTPGVPTDLLDVLICLKCQKDPIKVKKEGSWWFRDFWKDQKIVSVCFKTWNDMH